LSILLQTGKYRSKPLNRGRNRGRFFDGKELPILPFRASTPEGLHEFGEGYFDDDFDFSALIEGRVTESAICFLG
jgi:hypothetical protein